MEQLLTTLLATDAGQYIAAALVVLGALVTAASAIVPLTKTPKDDEILKIIKLFLIRFSILKPKGE